MPHSASAIQYTYDLNGNRTSMTGPTGITYYEYDALNRLISITNPSAQTTSYEYDTVGAQDENYFAQWHCYQLQLRCSR